MAFSRRCECKNKPASFCYVCGWYTLLLQRHNITSFVKRAYKAYFQLFFLVKKTRNGHLISCIITVRKASRLDKRETKKLPFEVLMVWREPRNYVTDCYFCIIINTKVFGKKNWH